MKIFNALALGGSPGIVTKGGWVRLFGLFHKAPKTGLSTRANKVGKHSHAIAPAHFASPGHVPVE
jgi:hypothetical protein